MDDLPPGFRFYPTEDELVSFYLHNKLEGKREDLNRVMNRVIPVVDIYEFNPWDLPQFSGVLCYGDPEQWFFFIPRQESEARGGRPRRLTTTGYWKATGSPNYVYSSNNRMIGVKRTMVFYNGRAPNGKKTEWKMNEYKAIEGEASVSSSATPALRQEFSLCRVYKKSKCLRAFDRRPSGVVIGGQPPAHRQVHHGDMASTSGRPNRSSAERTSSPEGSSSSGDHGHPSQAAGESENMDMAVDNDPLWPWDQLIELNPEME
ncbi:hypothetical protein FH972_016642 [Carpinus fangiana]|uniref:NAC domain-containing protein n=1 Tax=Carpinus fangiana TaxID=176857 RepID=A0A5N6RK97_9ROSI|nr:hypothetical protein FH972_016642 [Carpinus fangiana]